MGHQLQKAAVAVGLLEVAASVDEHGAVVVLKAAIALIHQMQDHQIAVGGRGGHTHQAATGLADAPQILQQCWVPFQQPALLTRSSCPAHQLMGNAVHRKVVGLVRTGLQRGIQQVIQVAGLPNTVGAGQRHKSLPTSRERAAELMGSPSLTLQFEHHSRQSQKAVLVIQVAVAHGEFRRQHPVANGEETAAGVAFHTPGRGLQALEIQHLAALLHHQALELTHVIAHQIRPRRPARQSEPHPRQPRRNLDLNGHQMLLGLAQIEMDLNHGVPQGFRLWANSRVAPGRSWARLRRACRAA